MLVCFPSNLARGCARRRVALDRDSQFPTCAIASILANYRPSHRRMAVKECCRDSNTTSVVTSESLSHRRQVGEWAKRQIWTLWTATLYSTFPGYGIVYLDLIAPMPNRPLSPTWGLSLLCCRPPLLVAGLHGEKLCNGTVAAITGRPKYRG